jgi:Family of unknown function (DUF5302)
MDGEGPAGPPRLPVRGATGSAARLIGNSDLAGARAMLDRYGKVGQQGTQLVPEPGGEHRVESFVGFLQGQPTLGGGDLDAAGAGVTLRIRRADTTVASGAICGLILACRHGPIVMASQADGIRWREAPRVRRGAYRPGFASRREACQAVRMARNDQRKGAEASPESASDAEPSKAEAGNDQPADADTEDDVRRKFRESLKRKKDHGDHLSAEGGHGKSQVQDGFGPAQRRRSFRRKSGS